MVLSKKDIPRPALPAETHEVPELGGEIIVQSLLLRDRLEMLIADSGQRSQHIAKILSITVVDAERVPIFNAEEWEAFGAKHTMAALNLLDIALRLSGMKEAEDSEKKESAQS